MFGEIFFYELSLYEWLLIGLCGILVGMAKTGVSGSGTLAVPIFAVIFGGKPSTGILLPMLIMADIYAVKYYHRHANWRHVMRPMPWVLTGITIALVVGSMISEKLFTLLIAFSIIIGLAIMFVRDISGKQLTIPDNWWFAAIIGIVGGFSTMIGNAAGPIMSIYLLALCLPKNNFIGTKAWFFLLVNLTKLPLHIFFWKTINVESFTFNLMALPAILLGALLGVRIVKLIPEKGYRLLIIITTALSAAIMIVKINQ